MYGAGIDIPELFTGEPDHRHDRYRKVQGEYPLRNGVLITDEPEKLGGKDAGPDRYMLLLSSLVSCTMATMRMYIDHKGLDIPDIFVEANMFHRLESEGAVIQIERRIDIATVRMHRSG